MCVYIYIHISNYILADYAIFQCAGRPHNDNNNSNSKSNSNNSNNSSSNSNNNNI